MLKKTKYTIIIGDESYDKIGFVTPRFYECAKYNVIPFVDKDFDKDELIIPMNSWLRVNNFHEMMNKIHFLEKNVDELVNICEELKGICTQTDLVEGNNIYNELI